MTQFQGQGFKYFIDGVKVDSYDEFERKIKSKEVIIKVEGLNVKAKSV